MYGKQEAVQRHSVSLAWRLDREMRRRLFLHETKRVYSLNVFYFILYRRSLCTAAPHLKKIGFFWGEGRLYTGYIDVDTFYLFLNWFSTSVSDDRKYVCGRRLYSTRVYSKYTKIQGPRFQRNYIIARDKKVIKNGTSFQSSPKINRMLITSAYSESLQHPNIAVLLIKILLLIFFLTTQKCSPFPK